MWAALSLMQIDRQRGIAAVAKKLFADKSAFGATRGTVMAAFEKETGHSFGGDLRKLREWWKKKTRGR